MNHISNVQQELTQILPQIMGEEYFFATELPLHPKPMGARGFSAISFATAGLYQTASTTRGPLEYMVRGLATGVAAAGYSVNAFLVVAEIACSVALAILLSTTYYAAGASSDFLKNSMIKAWGYCIHSVATLAVQVVMLFNSVYPEHHSVACFLSHSAHLLSAAVVTWYFDQGLDDEDKDVSALLSAIHTFIQNGPLVEFLYALDRDFGEGATAEQFRALLQRQSIVTFLQHYPQHEAVVQDLGIDVLFQPAYRRRWRDMAADFVYYSYHPHARGAIPVVHELNNNSERDAAYQNALVEHVKTAIAKIKADDNLIRYLSDTDSVEEAREALESFWPQIYIPIAQYAQLQELMAKEVACPVTFESVRLKQYNKRHSELVAARTLLQAIPENTKPTLTKKLLQPSAALPVALKDLVDKIHALAGALHQGTLMSVSTIESITGHISAQNLFQKACMEALG